MSYIVHSHHARKCRNDVCARARARPIWTPEPVILLTGQGDAGSGDEIGARSNDAKNHAQQGCAHV